MRRPWLTACLVSAIFLATQPAHACIIDVELDLNDIKYADVVVVGRISNYKIVLDEEARKEHREFIAELPPELRQEQDQEEPTGFMSDYARFDVLVDEVLLGEAPKTLSVTWDNSTFGEPEDLFPGPVLVALRKPSSDMPPLRGPSATILPSREHEALTVLQAPCSGEFIFDSAGEEATEIRKILAARRK